MVFWAGKQDMLRQGFIQHIWSLIYPWLVYEGVSILVTLIYLMFLLMRDPSFLASMKDMNAYVSKINQLVLTEYIWIAFFTCLLTIPLMLLFAYLDRQKEKRLGMRFECFEKAKPPVFVLCFICGIAVCVVFNHILMFSGLYELLSKNFEPVADLLYTGNFLLELLTVGVLTPIVEELIFRGLIYRRLRWSLDARWAAVLSAMLFAVFHGNLLQGIYAFGIGLLMAFVYERYHHILAPVLIHVGANLISVLLSEAEPLQFIYETDVAFWAVTVIMMGVFVLSFYWILVSRAPAKIEAKPAGTVMNTSIAEEEEDGERTV